MLKWNTFPKLGFSDRSNTKIPATVNLVITAKLSLTQWADKKPVSNHPEAGPKGSKPHASPELDRQRKSSC